MQYRTMPKSKDRLSALGFGLMRLPQTKSGKIDEDKALAMLHFALDNGVNYFDTAWGYHGGASEPLLGEFVTQTDRSKLFIATKLPCWLVKTRADMDSYLNQQLERLKTDHIDYYLLHALNARSWKEMLHLGVLDWLDNSRADGRIRHIGFSFHDEYSVFKQIVERYDWDFCQFMLNFLDTQYQAGMKGYKLASAKGLGIIAMEPLRGGKLVDHVPDSVQAVWAKSKNDWSPVQRALNWVWNLESLSVLLSGMSNMDQLKENISLANAFKTGQIDEKEMKLFNKARLEYLHRIAIPCSECRYCLPCPHGVSIPSVFGYYNESMMFGEKERHQKEYRNWTPTETRASKCVGCGECLSKCPQHIPIPDWMKTIADYFGD
ncbi:MAG TPA: aldo/keto reductase [Candidatus Syntrophosphaera sp.]|nr:aldo/keto reductase [Candidatus Cloacimonadota bacterium]HOR02835.1 aldo/keto reductase [Candidatus Syntrophosphaera sp.]HPK82802.1 aldo/keto reductase [Candidatus Syntrophosphaera sp.]HQG93707.1 aldo/keto reductase [Candidatus Syntrophosphaera sp.]HQK29610.1 aldo/keto reductase [Candidatus Syntrophosphaera sp.]